MLLSDIPQHLDLFGEDAAFYVNKNDEAGIAAQIQFILNPENSQLLELKKSVAYSALINNRESCEWIFECVQRNN
ncbi:MAG: hypothetical protein IPL13_13710 [Saprospiraceae bacterium]|nr:hypothetical protein [Candidatus Brachybacter algidus]